MPLFSPSPGFGRKKRTVKSEKRIANSSGVPGGTGSEETFTRWAGLWEEECFRILSQPTRLTREPPHRRWRQTGWYLPPSSVGVNRRFSEHQRRKPPPHRGQSPLWKNAAIQAVPVTRAPAPHFPQVVDRGRAGILQWRKQRRTKGEWSHEAGTDRTRTLRLQQ